MPSTTTLVASDPDRIRDDLVDGIRRTNAHRQRRNSRIVGSLAMVALAAVGITAWSMSTTEPAFALRQTPQGVVEVEIYPEFDSVDDLQSQLEEAGIDAIVVALRGHPSLDGLVEVVSHEGEADGSVVRSFDGHRLVLDPAEFSSSVEILVYHAARAGETYQFAPSIFAPGQPLAGLPCALTDRPLTSAEIESRAAGVGLTEIAWLFHRPGSFDEPGTIEELEARPDGVVAGAQFASAEQLRVTVRPSVPDELPAADLYEGYTANDGSHARVSPAPCTEALAAAWRPR